MSGQTKPPRDPADRVLADRIVELVAAADADGRANNSGARDKVVSTIARVLTTEALMDLRTALERTRGLA